MLDGWTIASLADCGTWLSGGTPSKARQDYWGGNIPWVSAKDMKQFRLNDSEDHVTRQGVKNGTRIIPPGTILLLIRGMTLHNDVPVCVAMTDMAFNQDVKAIVPRSNINMQFLAYWFVAHKPYLLSQVDSASHGTGRLYPEMLKQSPILLPPLPEQQAIASVLGALDDKIELNRRMNETLESMARALFQSWFVDFDPVRARIGRQPFGMDAEMAALFPCAFADSPLGQVPAGWIVEQIGNCTRVIGGSTPSTGNAAFWEGGDIHWATPKDLSLLSNRALLYTDRKITLAGLQQISSGLLPKGTVLMSSRAPIGYFAIAEVPVAINQGFIAMVCDSLLPNHYVLNWAEDNMDAIIGRANGTTFLEISKASFRPIPVLVPPKSVLDRFCERAEALHRKVVTNLEQSQTLAMLRDILLPKLMSGEVRVRDAERIVGDKAAL